MVPLSRLPLAFGFKIVEPGLIPPVAICHRKPSTLRVQSTLADIDEHRPWHGQTLQLPLHCLYRSTGHIIIHLLRDNRRISVHQPGGCRQTLFNCSARATTPRLVITFCSHFSFFAQSCPLSPSIPARAHTHTHTLSLSLSLFTAHFQQKFVITSRLLRLQPRTARTLLTVLSAQQYMPLLESTKVLSSSVKAVATTRKRSNFSRTYWSSG